ncbi:MAG: tetratricopeptide repeat protein [Planctomycetaceae bacterium]|nr:tetratricopeptide repeat protein [Planctomycetaceae bacterium]
MLLIASVTTEPTVCANELFATERELLADAADGSLDEFSLLEGSLIASGVTDRDQLEQFTSAFATRIAAKRPACSGGVSATASPEQIYNLLHEEFLTGQYYSTCTEVNRALDDGDYNCVTATVLFHCVGESFGLTPVAVATSTHVRSRLVADKPFDVETTCRDWFQVVRRDPNTQIFRSEQQVTRQLTNVELLAKIYYNRGVSLLENKAFADAIALLKTSQLLDPVDAPTRENIAAGMNNWALAECDANNFAHAVELVQQGLSKYPEFAPLLANDVHIHQRWAVALCEEHRYSEAMQALHAAHLRRADVALFDRGRTAVLAQWATALFEKGELETASKLFTAANGWFDELSEISRCRSIAVQEAAASLARRGRTDEANRLVRWGGELDSATTQF